MAEMTASENRYYEAVIQNSPAAIVVVDRDSSIREWNPAAERLFGYSREEAIGKNIDGLVTNEAIFEEAAGYSERTMQGDAVHVTTRRVRKDGSLVDVEVLGVPIYTDEAEITDFMAIYHDISELQRARQEALAASQAKSEFLANMSHEIRTPMNGVIGMTSLLLDTPLTAEQREYAETIRKSGDALLAIINDILDFSKIEAGKLELEAHAFDLRECIESALDLMAYQAAEKGLELLYHIDEDAPRHVVGDVTRLRQILSNLLSNAIKFTEKGEVEVSTRKEGGTAEEVTLRFAVRDTGIGVAAEQRERLFQIFSQVDASTTRRFGGTGLGLSICKRLTELMGGRIWVESEGAAGKGSTFKFTLTFGIPREVHEFGSPAQRLHLQGKRALIVDDNATNRLILARMTAAWGMTGILCASGREALEKIEAGAGMDVALLDVQMPEMDGLMLAEALRGRCGADTPIVFLSSLGVRVEQPEGMQAAYLNKPIKPANLYDTLMGVLAKQQAVAQAGPAEREGLDSQMGSRQPLRILLAEDHPVNQKVVRLMLERLGYRADVAGNGLEVLEAFQRQGYDVVLMDVQMPEMNGVEATQRLRATLGEETQPRIIALTADALGGGRDEYLAAGMDDYLSKPVNVLQLREALEKCMPVGFVERAGEAAGSPARAAGGPAEAAEGAIDVPTLKEFFPYEGEEVQMVIELAEEFFVDSEERMGQLEKRLREGEAEAFGAMAHALKGASLTFGAKKFSGLCRELEMMGKSGNLEGAEEKLAMAREEFGRVRAELALILKGMYRG
ncbi:MAG: response regulator [Chloroflexota bacterium]